LFSEDASPYSHEVTNAPTILPIVEKSSWPGQLLLETSERRDFSAKLALAQRLSSRGCPVGTTSSRRRIANPVDSRSRGPVNLRNRHRRKIPLVDVANSGRIARFSRAVALRD
jgi:hypothetical protein